jgi:hypothetical protein
VWADGILTTGAHASCEPIFVFSTDYPAAPAPRANAAAILSLQILFLKADFCYLASLPPSHQKHKHTVHLTSLYPVASVDRFQRGGER